MNIASIRVLVVFLLMIAVPGASAHELVIGLSPYQEPASAKAQVKSVLQFMTETLGPGESCLIVDAYHIRSLGTFKVPNKPAYRHKKARLQANRNVIKNVFAFAKQAHRPKGSHEPSLMGAIRLPQALRFVGENYPAATDSDLLLLGNPLYDDHKERDFSMAHYHIPGDGHLSHARSVTPYGIKGQETMLAKRRVHLGFADESWKRDDHHGYYVQRFWTLFIEGQGGLLSTFTSDLTTLFERVKTNSQAPQHAYEVQETSKLEMILLRPPVVEDETSIYERPLTKAPLASDMVSRAPNVEIGLTWDGKVDLDLYAKTDSEFEALSYLNTQTPQGKYFKDWMRSPRVINGYETIAYTRPIDLKKLVLFINWFHGSSSQGVKGELRLSLDGKTYAKPFHLKAAGGNGGDGREETLESGQAANVHWLVINPLEVIGLQDAHPVLTQR